jgi:hypothetical protein
MTNIPMNPPRVVTFATPFRGQSRSKKHRSLIRDEDISMLSIADDGETSSASERLYSKYHPIIWMLLMFMALTLHQRYKDLFGYEDENQNRSVLSTMDEFPQQVPEQLDFHKGSPDHSNLVISLAEQKPETTAEQIDSFLRGVFRKDDSGNEEETRNLVKSLEQQGLQVVATTKPEIENPLNEADSFVNASNPSNSLQSNTVA